jgi:hypothetical protein
MAGDHAGPMHETFESRIGLFLSRMASYPVATTFGEAQRQR